MRWTTTVPVVLGAGAGLAALAGLAAYEISNQPAEQPTRAGHGASADAPLRAIPPPPGTAPPLVTQAVCPSTPTTPTAGGVETSRAERTAAQHALEFLARDTLAWQASNNCYGCHVQAVTLDAMIVARRHNYDVSDHDFRAVLHGMLDIPGGAHGPIGFSVQDLPGHLVETSQSFGGAALAEYDEHIDRDLERELIAAATALLEYQEQDGSVRSTDHRPPVVAGTMQSTTQAARTWRQAHARTADDRWLEPIARAERYIRTRAGQLTDQQNSQLQDLSYAIVGLLAAGADSSEDVVQTLAAELSHRQNADGGFAHARSGASDAFATGQALYVLKRLGVSDADPAARRATGWLLEHQAADGGWGTGGTGRAMAMWAVLGLVTLDVASIEMAEGPQSGEHVEGSTQVRASATGNEGEAVVRMDLRLDDRLIASACGASLEHELDADRLESGPHRIELAATTTSGRTGTRRTVFYSGAYYVTGLGTRFDAQSTTFSWRSLARDGGEVILDVSTEGGQSVLRQRVPATQGAMQSAWDGRGSDGAARPRGRYVATLAYVRDGSVIQTESLPFVHDTSDVQDGEYAQVNGEVRSAEGANENAIVELVDDRGQVVQQTRSTRSGEYRFRNVQQGNYRVRVNRPGWTQSEAPVQAMPAASSRADMTVHAQ